MIDPSELGKTIGGKTPEQWHREFRARLEVRRRQRARAIETDRRWRAAVTAELNRRRGLLGWLGLR